VGTIGGGRLEYDAIRRARERLRHGDRAVVIERTGLGPSLGQCCGGAVQLRYEPIRAEQADALRERLSQQLVPVTLFGGGHVGTALVRVLAPLPFAVRWIDSRDEIFPAQLPPQVVCEHSDPVHAAVPGIVTGSHVLIMSFSHAEDLDVVAACLARQRAERDLRSIGLIGSRTKWATFRHRLEARGFTAVELDAVRCPIGLPSVAGKEPEVIAVSVAAQLLSLRETPPRH
jgi:xanthine dehydrogenase accessory factor